MSHIEVTCCDICHKDVFDAFGDYSYISFSNEEAEHLYPEEMDICWECFKKHILPLKKDK